MDVAIKPIAIEHVEEFHRTLDAVARERRFLAMLEAPPLSRTRAFVDDNIRNGYSHFVACAEGQVVGWCDIIPEKRPTESHIGILGMGLLPAFRGRGLGAELIKSTMCDALQKGVIRIELKVVADNAPAIRLYERMGFEREGVLRDAVFIDGQFKDNLMMAIVHRR